MKTLIIENMSGAENENVILCKLSYLSFKLDEIQVDIEEVIVCRKKNGYKWSAMQMEVAIWDILDTQKIELVIFENIQNGAEVSVRLACRTGGESILNVTNIKESKGQLLVTKPVYLSNINIIYRIDQKPCFTTLRDGVRIMDAQKQKEPIISLEREYWFEENKNITCLGNVEEHKNTLGNAKRVVIAGKGIKQAEDLLLLKKFAEHINAELGGTRPLIMSGMLPAERLIGQSGKILAPDLCIAVGVSGATPLAVGISQSKKIIAINQDVEAPIFNIADIGIVADYHGVIQRFVK